MAVQEVVRAGAHRTPAAARPGPRKWRRALIGWSFAAPFTALFLVFALLPVVASLLMSVTDMRSTDLRHPFAVTFVGLDNYTRLFADAPVQARAAPVSENGGEKIERGNIGIRDLRDVPCEREMRQLGGKFPVNFAPAKLRRFRGNEYRLE